MTNESSAESRSLVVCSRCCKWLPLESFRRRSKRSDLRMRHCGNCHSQYERQRRKAKRLQAAGLMTQKVASQSARSDSLERVSALLNLLVTRLGGPHEFYRFWLDEIDRLKAQRRSGFRLIRFCEMVGNYEFLCFADAAEFQLFAMNH